MLVILIFILVICYADYVHTCISLIFNEVSIKFDKRKLFTEGCLLYYIICTYVIFTTINIHIK